MKALLIMNLQNDFCVFGNLSVESADLLTDKANLLMPFFDKVIAVNFAYPPNHQSFAANHLFRQPGKSMLINGREQLLKPIHCVDGSYGAEFPSGLYENKIDYQQKVGRDATIDIYSMFRESDNTENNLSAFLHTARLEELYFMGIFSDFFVKSVEDGKQKGFSIKIVEDACAGTLDLKDFSKICFSEIIS